MHEASLLPYIQHLHDDSLEDQFSTKIATLLSGCENGPWTQSASVLPFKYDKYLQSLHVKEPDAFSATLGLFGFCAHFERQFLTMMDTQIQMQLDFTKNTASNPLEVLMRIMRVLQDHMKRLDDNITTLEWRGEPEWPLAAPPADEYHAEDALTAITQEFKHLLREAGFLSMQCRTAMNTVTEITLANNRKQLIVLDANITRLTYIGVVLWPLSFILLFSGRVGVILFWTWLIVGVTLWNTSLVFLFAPRFARETAGRILDMVSSQRG